MATLATFFKRSDAVGRTGRASAVRAESDPFRLRAMPADDIYFFSKTIDNSRVVRQADPAARGECWSFVGAVAVLLMLGGTIVAPHVGSILAGYRLEALKQEHRALLDQKRELEVREAGLLSPVRLNALARTRNLTNPASDQVFHLENQAREGSFARVHAPASSSAGTAR